MTNAKRRAAELQLLSIRLEELALETQDTDRELAVKVFQLRERVEGIIQDYMRLNRDRDLSLTKED